MRLAQWARRPNSSVKRIVLMGSHAGHKHPEARWGAYSLGKMAMEDVATLLAVDLGTIGATINVVCPSSIDLADTKSPGIASMPTGRTTSANDVAAVVSFLLSDEASQINGAAIAVDGGLP